MKDSVTVNVKVTGETTDEVFEGVFIAKVKLSHRDVLKQDEIYRVALGVKPNDASDYASAIANNIAYLSIRLTKAPPWFTESGNGIDLKDENVLVQVTKAVAEAIGAELTEHAKAAEEKQKALKDKLAADTQT
jgi:hypothetical protein